MSSVPALESTRFSVIKITVAILICSMIGVKVLTRFADTLLSQAAYEEGLYQQGAGHQSLLARLRASARTQH